MADVALGHPVRAYLAVAGAALRAQAERPAYLAVRMLLGGAIQLLELTGFVILIDQFGELAGWSAPEIGVLWGLGAAGQGLAQTVASRLEAGDFAGVVRRGELDRVLLRPVGALPWLLASSLDLRYLGRTLTGLAITAWAADRAGVVWTPGRVAVAVLAVLCCAVVFVAVLVIAAAVTLRTVEGSELFNVLTYGGVFLAGFPMEVHGPPLRFLFTWVLPFGLAVYVPALVILGRPGAAGLTPALLAVTPLAAAALAVAAVAAWRAGLRGYLGTGS